VGESKYGETIVAATDRVNSQEWLECCFAQTELVRFVCLLRNGYLRVPSEAASSMVPVKHLGELAVLGPDRRDVYDGFSVSPVETPYLAFWGHDANKVTSVSTVANGWLSPLTKAGRGRHLRDTALLWSRAGRIMICERMRLNTQRVTAVRLPKRALANVWWPVRLKSDDDERRDKALALWLNSTLGLVLLIAYRIPTEGSWVSFKKPVLERMPVLDVDALEEATLALLAKKFDEVSTKGLEPISSLNHDSVRRRIDQAFMNALGLPDLQIVTDMLAREPVVANNRLQPPGLSEPSASPNEANVATRVLSKQ
jgi:hypothetical protein